MYFFELGSERVNLGAIWSALPISLAQKSFENRAQVGKL